MSKIACVIIAAALIAQGALAQTAPEVEPDIVVLGAPLDEPAQAYVQEIAPRQLREDQLARWDEWVCIGAAGLSAADGQMLVDRISARASAVGLRVGAPGCRANIMVIFASNSDAIARRIVDERRDLMGYFSNDAVSTGGREGLEEFASTPRPIRWWHVARNVTADGRTLDDPNTSPAATGAESLSANRTAESGGGVSGAGSFNNVQTVRSDGSRLRRTTRQDLNYVLVIVDAQRVAAIPAPAWIDYVAMASLAQINPNAAPSSAPSVLHLFTAPAGSLPEGMTAWDIAYLDGLYRATREATSTLAQQREISRSIVDTISRSRVAEANTN